MPRRLRTLPRDANTMGQGQAGTSGGNVAPYQRQGLSGGVASGQVPYGQNNQQNYSQWHWDANVGAYVNSQSGQIADQPGGAGNSLWDGFSQQGINTPAVESMTDDQWNEWVNYGDQGGYDPEESYF